MRLSPLPLALLLALAPAAARAGSPFYGAARVGGFVPTELQDAGTGFNVELGVGWWAMPHLAFEATLGRGSVAAQAGYDVPNTTDPVFTKLTLFPMTATARLELWLGQFRPYALAGGGAVVVRNRPEISIAGESPLSTSWTEAALSLTAGGGVVVQADERFSFGLEGRYAWGSLEKGGGEVKLDGATLTATMEMRL